ncbi:chymotrypsin family serine protease [Algoriphagus resistens]|uniref:hypothetical protein n=1 Tax=Algoriphagus resistens TaxID=1750590 RepID=UPI000716974C|nr:hypothetical protein [Algoriphagus resistens]
MDKVIQPTIVLLILSLITEKIANFIKLQYDSLASKQNTDFAEKNREKKIQTMSIFVGTAIALIAKANLFDFFKDDFNLFWIPDDFKGWKLLSNIVGSIISGMFLSLGSKFFHDLLDILLQVKNLKRKLNEKADWEFDNINEVDDYIKGNDIKRLKIFLDDTFKGVQGYFFYELDYENQAVNVHVKEGTTGIQNTIPFKTLTGKTKLLRVKIVVEENDIKTLSSAIKPSDEIANQQAYRNALKGSVAYPVLRNGDNKKFILTCYHAVWNENHDWDIFIPIGKEDVVHPINGSPIGKIKFAFKNSWLDVALIETNLNISIDISVPLLNIPKAVRKIDETDKRRKTTLKIKSITNNAAPTTGFVDDVDVSANIKYPDGKFRELSNLIRIKPYSNLPFSIGGDSGALVVDEWNYAVGIIVAGNEKDVTFAIPIKTILDNLNLKLN